LIESGENGEPKLVYLVYLVYLVCLVGRTGKPTRRTRETRETRQTNKEPRRIGGEWIRCRLIAEGTAVGTEGIVQAVRLEGASSPEGIGRGIRIERIGAQLAEIFGADGERQWQQQEQKEEDDSHGEPPTSRITSGLSLLPARRSGQTLR